VDKPPPRSRRGKMIASAQIHITSLSHHNCEDFLPGCPLIERRS